MVNSKEFANRLQEILDFYDLSASAFARRIGVQPSGISHLLSGRNKPSLDFVLRVIETFPEVELYWLLNGKGSFPAQGFTQKSEDTLSPSDLRGGPSPLPGAAGTPSSGTPRPSGLGRPGSHVSPSGSDSASHTRSVNQIIVCYSDGTFESYRPS